MPLMHKAKRSHRGWSPHNQVSSKLISPYFSYQPTKMENNNLFNFPASYLIEQEQCSEPV